MLVHPIQWVNGQIVAVHLDPLILRFEGYLDPLIGFDHLIQILIRLQTLYTGHISDYPLPVDSYCQSAVSLATQREDD